VSKTIPRFIFQDARWYKLTLDKNIAATFDYIVTNANRTGNNFFLRNNTMYNHRARGFLIKASQGTIIENTLDGSSMFGMEVAPELYWSEADYVHDLVIKNNVIRRVGYHMQQGAGIMVGAVDPLNNFAQGYGHKNVLIQENVFEDVNITNLLLTSAEGIHVVNNKFLRPFGEAPWRPGQQASSVVYMTELQGNDATQNCMYQLGPHVWNPPVTVTPSVQNNVTGAFTDCTFGSWIATNE